jgi:cell cycle sensor histidine kinase DivJ
MPGSIFRFASAARTGEPTVKAGPRRRLAHLVAAMAFLAAPFAIWAVGQGGPAGLLAAAPAAALALAALLLFRQLRLRPEADLAQPLSETALRDLVEKVRDGVLRLAPDGGVNFASRSAAALLGCPRYALAGSGLFDRVHVLDRPAWLTAFDHVRRTGTTRTLELRLRQDDPEAALRTPRFVWVGVEIAAVPDETDLVVLFEDITDRRAREAGSEDVRSADADTADDKARVFATIGHELRTPLNAMVGFAEMMTSGLAGPLNATQADYAGLIGKSGRHLISVVDMLLDISRLEAGRMDISTALFDPAGIVAPSLALLEPMAGERGVRLVAELPAALPAIRADERACRQIISNLVSNAIKFSRDGGTVTVSMRRQGKFLCLQVSDTGIGMAPESLSRLGEPFFQAHQGLDRRYEGTGLGLSIVKGLTSLHGGRMVAQSSPGEGTVMSVLLPINGPATKLEDTARVVSLDRDPVTPPMSIWPDARRSAR